MPCLVKWSDEPDTDGLYHQEIAICIPGPMKTFKEEKVPERWCFACRKRSAATWRLRGEEGITYYDPIWIYACDNCGKDGELFPGYERVWE